MEGFSVHFVSDFQYLCEQHQNSESDRSKNSLDTGMWYPIQYCRALDKDGQTKRLE